MTLLACAHVEAPNGGPEDKSAPRVAGIYPAQGSTEVSQELLAIIEFNEWVNDRVNFKHANISPPLSQPLQLESDGNRLYIRSIDSLSPQTTYTLTISTAIQDLRSNNMSKPFSLSFSTGVTLDSLNLSGYIDTENLSRLPQSTIVALYPVGQIRDSLPYLKQIIDSLNPQVGLVPLFRKELPMYLTEADTMGYFNFQSLRPGTYRIVAFDDKNSNRMIEIDQEQVGLFYKDLTLVDSLMPIALSLSSLDTNSLIPDRIKSLPHSQIMIQFNHPPHWSTASPVDQYQLSRPGDTIPPILPQFVYRDPISNMPILKFDRLPVGEELQLKFGSIKDSNERGIDSLYQLKNFIWKQDSSKLRVIQVLPQIKSSNISTDSLPQIYFDRPIIRQEWFEQILLTFNGDTIAFALDSITPNGIQIRPSKPPGQATEISISRLFRDTSLQMKSSGTLDTVITIQPKLMTRYTTLDPLKTTSLRGSFPECDTQQVIRLYFSQAEHMTRCNEEGNFSLRNIETGKWFIESFKDLNDDNIRQKGQITPFEYSEPYFRIADTLFLGRDSVYYLDSLLQKDSL